MRVGNPVVPKTAQSLNKSPGYQSRAEESAGRVLFGMQSSVLGSKSVTPGPGEPLEGLLDEILLDEALDQFETPKNTNSVRLNSLQPGQEAGQSANAALRMLRLLTARGVQPPQERVILDRPQKVQVARALAVWMEETLTRQGVTVAVVARQGGRQHRQHDVTGMLHSGIVWRDPLEQRWKIYNLLDFKGRGKPQCHILWTDPVDFFYQQGGYQKEALLLFPPKPVQEGIADLLTSGGFQRLAFTTNYNLLSPPHGAESLNCNKWVLLNVLAAHKNTEDLALLLADIRQHYRTEPLALDPLTRLFSGWHPLIRGHEVPWWHAPQTVTVESLMKSGLFEHHRFCANQSHL